MNWKNLSRKKKSYILGFGAIVAVLLWAFVSAGIITHNFNRAQLQMGSASQEAFIHGMILTETKEDSKYWEIYGETGSYDNKHNVALLNNVVGNFYKDNEVSMSFESSKGTYNPDRKQIIMYENTFIAMKDGTTLRANRLEWSGSDKPITASGNVRITRGGQFLAKADSIEISADFESFKIKGNTVSKIFDK